jgi:superfamily II DNA or RNA helicase
LTIAERCASGFQPAVWTRGLILYQQGRVTLSYTADSRLTATVQPPTGAPYHVELAFDLVLSDIEALCTCQDYRMGTLCHHIWATVLAADEASWLQESLPLLHELTVSHHDEDRECPEFDASDERKRLSSLFGTFRKAERGRVVPLPRRRESRPPAPKPPTWQDQLQRIIRHTAQQHRRTGATPSTAQPRPRRAWYVWNIDMSLQASGLVLEYYHQERRQNGTFGTIKAQGVARDDVSAYEDPADQRLLELLLGHTSYEDRSASHAPYARRAPQRQTSCVVAPILYDLLVPELCASGRLLWVRDTAAALDDTRSVAWDDGAPWQFTLRIDADAARQSWRLQGQLVRGGDVVPLSDPILLLAEGLVLFPQHVSRLEASQDFGWIATLRQAGELRIPYAERDAFLQMWWSAPALPMADLPPDLDLPTARGVPTGTLTVFTPTRGHDHDLYANVTVHYEDHLIDPETFQAGIVDLKTPRVMRRDRDAETALLTQLSDLGVRPNPHATMDADYRLAPRHLPALTEALLQRGWVVKADGVRMRPPGTMTFQVTSGMDWFELHGQVAFEGFAVGLPALLRARRRGERYVLLDDGSQGLLPETWLARYGTFADLGESHADTIRFKPAQALLLDALLAEQQHLSLDPAFERWRAQLRTFTGIKPASPPETFAGQLRPYQQDGLGWLHFLQDFHLGGCLADDMGLGKTVQVLALLASRRDSSRAVDRPLRPSIVVVPRSLVFNWLLEAERFTPTLRVLDYTGPNREEALAQMDAADVLVTTYGILRRDIVTLKALPFDYAILDEAQAIKNADSQAAKASRLLQAEHRLALSGTPVENHLEDLWSLFEFLNPGMLGRSTVFHQITKPGEAQDDAPFNLLATAIRPVILRRTKSQVLRDLPDKTEQTLFCDLPAAQRQLYNELRDYYRSRLSQRVQAVGLQHAKIQILEALLRLRQAACHPGLIDPKRTGDPSAKLDALLEHLEAVIAEGHKALVFSQFTSLLAIVRQHLDERGMVYAYLDGHTRKRQERVERFQQDGTCPLFLISLKAGGHGLNLTAAEYVFILDPWWNPAVEAQAIDRAHRIGQTRPVFAYRLISRDTVEDKIVALQQSKRELAESIVAADGHLMRQLTAADLELLIS